MTIRNNVNNKIIKWVIKAWRWMFGCFSDFYFFSVFFFFIIYFCKKFCHMHGGLFVFFASFYQHLIDNDLYKQSQFENLDFLNFFSLLFLLSAFY